MAKGEGLFDNQDNNSPDLDQYAKDALDELFNKEEQSYEEFLQGFTFLKKEDVTGIKTHTSHIVIQNGDLCQKKKTNDSAVKYPLTQESQHLTENDGLPEEVLGPGSTACSILTRTAPSSGGSFLKVDNFVDCEDEATGSDDDKEEEQTLDPFLEDDFLSSETYSPSVPLTPSKSKTREIKDTRIQRPTNLRTDTDKEMLETIGISFLSGALSLPGEVEEQETAMQQDCCASKAVIKPNLRQLQISTRTKNTGAKDNNLNMEAEDADEVQPFVLDPNFDYDNVTLSPKYSFPYKHKS